MDLGMAVGSTGLVMLASSKGYHFIYGFSIVFLIALIIIYTFTFGIRPQQKNVEEKSA